MHATVPYSDRPLDKNAVNKAAKAFSAGEQLSPIKRGRIPKYPTKLADLLVEVLLVARKCGIRTGRTYTKYCAAVLLQGHAAEEHFVQKDGTILLTDVWFDAFVRTRKKELEWLTPENHASSREEWEKIENMLPHYIKYEESICLLYTSPSPRDS